MPQTWFITGAARGIGAEIVRVALAAGHQVAATGRDPAKIAQAFPQAPDRLLALALDVTDEAQAHTAAEAAIARFGRIVVLVNNAGYGQLGAFEESTDADLRTQFETNVFGLMHVTRAVLPHMRAARAGHIFQLSSIAGLRGGAGGSLYCASKWAVEGFSESLAQEVEPFGIRVTCIQPGFFRTDFLDPSSARFAAPRIADYAGFSARLKAGYEACNHAQAGDPVKLAALMLQLASDANPPFRFPAGTDAVEIAQGKIESRQAELDRWRELSATTDGDYDAV